MGVRQHSFRAAVLISTFEPLPNLALEAQCRGTYPVEVHGRTIFSEGDIITVLSPCSFVPDRHPYAIEMLKEMFNMTHRDYDVLVLCSEAPLSPTQCNVSRMQSAKMLEQRGLLLYSFRMQRWNLTITGQLFLEVIPLCLSEYDPVAKKRTPVLRFPCVSTK